MDSKGLHIIEIDKENGIFLEIRVFSGDLNNLATNSLQIQKEISRNKLENEQKTNSVSVNQRKLLQNPKD